jgi:hypothetical protein
MPEWRTIIFVLWRCNVVFHSSAFRQTFVASQDFGRSFSAEEMQEIFDEERRGKSVCVSCTPRPLAFNLAFL